MSLPVLIVEATGSPPGELRQAIEAHGDKERTAQALHVSYKTLLKKQREHGIGS